MYEVEINLCEKVAFIKHFTSSHQHKQNESKSMNLLKFKWKIFSIYNNFNLLFLWGRWSMWEKLQVDAKKLILKITGHMKSLLCMES